jgi:hypothetical protein
MTQTVQIEKMEELIDALGGGGGGGSSVVPTPESTDVGKVLTANDDGTASWDTIEAELPTVTNSDRGKALKVNKTNNNINWANISEVPDTTGASQGDVLTVGANGAEWATPSGGSGLPDYTTRDADKVLKVNPYGNLIIWSKMIGVPEYRGANVGSILTIDGSDNNKYLNWLEPKKPQFATLEGTPTERTNDVLYTFNLPTLDEKYRYEDESFKQIFYEDVIVPFNTQIGVDDKTVTIKFTNMPSGYQLDTIEVILEGTNFTNYTMESMIDNINVDMGYFVITTKVKTNQMFGTDMHYLKIRGLNERQSV